MRNPSDPISEIRWLPAFLGSDVDCPPYGLVRATGVGEDGELTVLRPDGDGLEGLFVAGPLGIPANGRGLVTADWPAFAAYEAGTTAGAPANGQTWGSKKDSYLLTSGNSGFASYGVAGSLAYVRPQASMTVAFVQLVAPANLSTTLDPFGQLYTARLHTGGPGESFVVEPNASQGTAGYVYAINLITWGQPLTNIAIAGGPLFLAVKLHEINSKPVYGFNGGMTLDRDDVVQTQCSGTTLNVTRQRQTLRGGFPLKQVTL